MGLSWNGLLCAGVMWFVTNSFAFVASFEAAVIAGLTLLALFMGDTETRVASLGEGNSR